MHTLLLLAALASSPGDRPIQVHCRGLEAYDIRGTYDVDWGWGTIRANDRSPVIGFSMGPMVESLVPAERPAGFRTFHVVRIGGAVLRYGFNVRKNQLQATLHGAPLDGTVNLFAPPGDAVRFLNIATTIATAPCEVRVDRR